MRLGPLPLVSALTVVACGSPFPNPGGAEVAALRAKDPAARLQDLARGRSLYLGKCGGCHLLIEPAKFPSDAWPANVLRMENEKKVALSDDDLRDITRYLVAVSAVERR